MKLKKEDIVSAFMGPPQIIGSILAAIFAVTDKQLVAATATGHAWTAEFDGNLDEVAASLATLGAAGESMTIDILKNGASVLLATTAFVAGGTAKVINLRLDPNKTSFKKGDVFTITRTYVPGGAPAMTVSEVIIRPAPFGDL